MTPAYLIAAAVLIIENKPIHYTELADKVYKSKLSGLGTKSKKTIGNTLLRQVDQDTKSKLYFVNRKGTISFDSRKRIDSKIESAVTVYRSYLNSLENNETQDHDILDDDEQSFPEGAEIYRLHILRERNSELVKRAKEYWLKNDPMLCCEVCGFSFIKKYGTIGESFIEAHHKYPLNLLTAEVNAKIEDLIKVCSNCHRMLHRKRPWIMTTADLKTLVLDS